MPVTTSPQTKRAALASKLRARLAAKRSRGAAKTIVVTVTASKAREEFSSWITLVSHGHKWLILKRHGKPAVAMVPVADLEALREMENAVDLEAARQAMNEPGEVSWEEVKAKLGL